MMRTVLLYGLSLAAGAWALQWIEYQVWARSHPGALYLALVALGFLGLGVWLGRRLFSGAQVDGPFAPNLQAQSSLGITDREYEVLKQLAAGRSNKEIAGKLNVSPNTVKTHVARLFEKLSAARRTEAILRARELGLLP